MDWDGKKAHFIGIRPVHLQWTIVDSWIDARKARPDSPAAPEPTTDAAAGPA